MPSPLVYRRSLQHTEEDESDVVHSNYRRLLTEHLYRSLLMLEDLSEFEEEKDTTPAPGQAVQVEPHIMCHPAC